MVNFTTPLIPLPPSTQDRDRKEANTNDPFDNLFTEPEPTQPLFITTIVTERPQRRTSAITPYSASSDFGAWVSVPAAANSVQHPLIDLGPDPAITEMPAATPSSDFFERFTDDAKVRAEQNERRVLNELLEHEDDPLYWLKPSMPDTDEADIHSNLLVDIDEHPSSEMTPESRRSSEDDGTATTHLSKIAKPIDIQRRSSSPQPSTLAATLPRKWMSTLLSSSVPALPATDRRDASGSPSQRKTERKTERKTVLPSLTHDSPFSTPVFIPPTGAPGFTGDHHWNISGFEFEEQDRRLRKIDLVGRRESTTPILTAELAEQLRGSLPALSRLARSWSLLYSMDQHGVSLHTFYARCAVRTSGTLIAIRDSEDHIFGAWLGEPIRISPGAYYGSGESFLWKIGRLAIRIALKCTSGLAKMITSLYARRTSFHSVAGKGSTDFISIRASSMDLQPSARRLIMPSFVPQPAGMNRRRFHLNALASKPGE